VVLATNVAETSLTVPGIHYVVDPGFARISRYSHRSKVQRLPVERISQASANQRRGRCGRVASGVCIRLYSEDSFAARAPYTEPEIQRTNLAAVILQMKVLGFGAIESFPFLDPPDPRLVTDGYRTLEELGAIDRVGEPTPLGLKLARLPVDPNRAHAARRGGSPLSRRGANHRQRPERPGPARAAPGAAAGGGRDPCHLQPPGLGLPDLPEPLAFLERERKALSKAQFRKLCQRHFLSWNRVQEWHDVQAQLHEQLAEMGILTKPRMERGQSNPRLRGEGGRGG
jgi:ATP-dependent helicase HrpA